jgi:hypothetical protein
MRCELTDKSSRKPIRIQEVKITQTNASGVLARGKLGSLLATEQHFKYSHRIQTV